MLSIKGDEMVKDYCSKEALKELSEKEIQLKELILKLIMETEVSDKEVVRTLAFLINSSKKIKR